MEAELRPHFTFHLTSRPLLAAVAGRIQDMMRPALLARYRDRMVGLAVDEVLDVRGVVVEDAPDGGVVRGLSTVDARAVVILDLDAMMHRVLLS